MKDLFRKLGLSACLAIWACGTAWAGPLADMAQGMIAGSAADVITAIEQGGDVNAEFEFYTGKVRVLNWAARHGAYALAKLALEKGADPNALADVDDIGTSTALNAAIHFHHPELVTLLLAQGARQRVGSQTHALVYAASQQDEAFLDLLSHPDALNLQESERNETLKQLVTFNRLSWLEPMLQRLGKEGFSQEGLGEALALAASQNQSKLFAALLTQFSQQLSAEALNRALPAAIDMPEILARLLAFPGPARLSQRGYEAALRVAAAKGSLELLDLLGEQAGPQGLSQAAYEQALAEAARAGQPEAMDWLVKRAGGPERISLQAYGEAAINAVAYGHLEALRWLEARIAPRRLEDKIYYQALSIAFNHQYLELAEHLLDQPLPWPAEALAESLKQHVIEFPKPEDPRFEPLLIRLLEANQQTLKGHPMLDELARNVISGYRKKPAAYQRMILTRFLAAGLELDRRHSFVDSDEPNGQTLLMLAIKAQERETVDFLLAQGADPELRDDSGMNALLWAATVWDMDLIETLVETWKVDREAVDKQGTGVVHFIAARGDTGALSRLAAMGFDLSRSDKAGNGLLYYGLGSHEPQAMLDFVIARGIQDRTPAAHLLSLPLYIDDKLALLERRLGPDFIRARDADGKTLLIQSAASAELETIKALVAKGADVRASDKSGLTPLLATRSAEVAQFLIAKGARPDEALRDGRNGVWLALSASDIEWYNPDKGMMFDSEAVMGLQYADYLLSKGAKPGIADKQGQRPIDLLLAGVQASCQKLEQGPLGEFAGDSEVWALYPLVLQHLMQRGVTISPQHPHLLSLLQIALNAKAESPSPALTKAVALSRNTFMKLILAGPIDRRETRVGELPSMNRTALMLAVAHEDEALTRFLLAHGANPSLSDANGTGPVTTAVLTGNNTILALLLQKKPRLDLVDQTGRTALQWATRLENAQAVTLLGQAQRAK